MSNLARHAFYTFYAVCMFSCSIFSAVICTPALAEEANSANTVSSNPQLDKLENKLFQHTYAKEDENERLTRIEKMIFGDTQKGNSEERLNALVKAVPNLDSGQSAGSEQSNINTANSNSTTNDIANGSNTASSTSGSAAGDDIDSGAIGNYPAITAMETKLLGKDFSNEPVKSRLERLEKKVLGKASTSDDLSDRMDKLKEATGIDIARKPNSSDWVEDEDDLMSNPPVTSMGGGGAYGFGRPDVYQDLQRSPSGQYGTPYSSSSRHPIASPYFPDEARRTKNPISIKNLGLNQQVIALEHETFNKTYEHDPLPARVNRLEAYVFPDQKPAVDKPLPQRVQNLLAKVPIPQDELQALAQSNQIDTTDSINQPGIDLSDPNNYSTRQSRSNLSKIISSLGNMLSGGMVGGFPMSSGNYIMDPQTGMLIDPNTGVMINPNTGTRYGGNSYSTGGMYGMGSGMYGMGNGFGSYNSFGGFGGFSPMMGMPYGMGPGFGFGGTGMGMGFGFR